MSIDDQGVDSAVDNIMQSLESGGLLKEDEAPLDTGSNQEIPPEEGQENTGADENQPTEDNKDKPNETETDEAETPIEPPASWRSDEKELFKTLPREVQDVVQRLQQASDSHFTQRSTELATKIRATDDERQQYQTQRAQFSTGLERLFEMASQLMPAKFQDIRNEADYLRLKAADPQRASEFEAFQGTLRMASQERTRLMEAQRNEHLEREWNALVEKTPNKDQTKAREAVDVARKTAVEYYGFTPQEVSIVEDHRHIAVLQDAFAWRQHQANLKAAQSKKVVTTPTRVQQQKSNSGSPSLADSRKTALHNRARNATNDRDKADAIARLFAN